MIKKRFLFVSFVTFVFILLFFSCAGTGRRQVRARPDEIARKNNIGIEEVDVIPVIGLINGECVGRAYVLTDTAFVRIKSGRSGILDLKIRFHEIAHVIIRRARKNYGGEDFFAAFKDELKLQFPLQWEKAWKRNTDEFFLEEVYSQLFANYATIEEYEYGSFVDGTMNDKKRLKAVLSSVTPELDKILGFF